MNKAHHPESIGPATAPYSYGIEVPAGARWLYISGQVGARQGQVGKTIEEQSEIAWRNLLDVLESAGMGIRDVVKVTAFLTDSRFVVPYRSARDRFQAGHKPASTLLIVQALAMPEWLVEVEAIAAKT
ncbi:MAG TPA: RidA family protein [Candidatus Cybelea sp.]|nr:RidA family protein [Candidatus Cybelea sp.]